MAKDSPMRVGTVQAGEAKALGDLMAPSNT